MARDRLAAIRAQQAGNGAGNPGAEQYQQPSYPREAGSDRPVGRSQRSYDEPSGSQERRPSGGRQQQRGYDEMDRSNGSSQGQSQQPRGLPSRNPRLTGAAGGGGGRRPNNPPPPQAMGGGGYDNYPPRDFDPRGGDDIPPTPPTHSPDPPSQQYAPYGSQGSMDYGNDVGRAVSYYETASYQQPEPRDFNPNSGYGQRPQSRHRSQSRSGGSSRNDGYGGQSQQRQQNPGPYYSEEMYEEKASTVELVDSRQDDDYEYANEKKQKPKKIGKKGGKTIKKGDVPYEEMGQFFNEVSDIQQGLRDGNARLQDISRLHSRILALPSVDDPQSQSLTAELKEATQQLRGHFSALKTRIHGLEQGNANLGALIPVGQSLYNLTLEDVNVRKTQVGVLKERFKESIQRYAEVEQENRAKNRARMERQVKVVNPGMSQDEVTQVVKQAESGGANAVFQQALMSSGQRSYAARGALREVESRAAELARIEETLVELAQLFNDMALLVEAQDVQIVQIEKTAEQVHLDVEKGLVETKAAVVSARGARNKRWWCFWILLILVIVAVVIIVIKVVLPIVQKNQANAAAAQSNNPSSSSQSAIQTAASSAGGSSSGATAQVTSAPVVGAVSTLVVPSVVTTITIPSSVSYVSGSGNGGFLPTPTARP